MDPFIKSEKKTSFNHVVMFLYAKQRIKCRYLSFISFLYFFYLYVHGDDASLCWGFFMQTILRRTD